jgi:hypothetical protein
MKRRHLPPRIKHGPNKGKFRKSHHHGGRHKQRRHHGGRRRVANNPFGAGLTVVNPSRQQLGFAQMAGIPGQAKEAFMKRKGKKRARRPHGTRSVKVIRRRGGRYVSRRGGLVLVSVPKRIRRVSRVRLGKHQGAVILRKNPFNARGLFGLIKVGFAGFLGVATARAAGYWYDQKLAASVIGTDTTVTWRKWLNVGVRAAAQGGAVWIGSKIVAGVSRPYATVYAIGGYGETVRQVVGGLVKAWSPASVPDKYGLGQIPGLPAGRRIVRAFVGPDGRRVAQDNAGDWYEIGGGGGMAGPTTREEFSAAAQDYLSGPTTRGGFSADAQAYLGAMGYSNALTG